MDGNPVFRVCADRCDTCVFRLHYDKETRDALFGEVERNDSYVQCHAHADSAAVCCRGYWDAFGDSGGTPVQLAWRFEKMGIPLVEWVGPDEYPPGDDDAED